MNFGLLQLFCCRLCLLPGDGIDPLYLQLRFISSVVSGPLLHLFPLLDGVWEHPLLNILFMSRVNNGNISLSLTVRPTLRLSFSFYRRIWWRSSWQNPSLQPLNWHLDRSWTVDWTQVFSSINYRCRHISIQWHLQFDNNTYYYYYHYNTYDNSN